MDHGGDRPVPRMARMCQVGPSLCSCIKEGGGVCRKEKNLLRYSQKSMRQNDPKLTLTSLIWLLLPEFAPDSSLITGPLQPYMDRISDSAAPCA